MSKRFVSLVASLAMAFLVTPAAAASPGSLPAQGPALVAGRLTDAQGQPAQGMVFLYQDALDEANALNPLQSQETAPDGSYSFTQVSDPSLDAAAGRNGGYANFVLIGATGTHSTAKFFSRQLTQTRWTGRWDTASVDLSANRRLSPEDGEQLAELRSEARTASEPESPYACEYELARQWYEFMPVGELHTWYQDMEGSFSYGAKADTTSTVGVKADGAWGFGGEVQLSNTGSSSVQQTVKRTGKFGRILEQEFRLKHWKRLIPPNGCGPSLAPDDIVKPVAWTTGWDFGWDDSRFDGKCVPDLNADKSTRLVDDDLWERKDESRQLTSFGFTIPVGSANVQFRTQSGSSVNVVHTYKTGDQRSAYWICGNNKKPSAALRIFAGHKPPEPSECYPPPCYNSTSPLRGPRS